MFDYLAAKEYPGRGIILGKSEDNRAVFAYFIMGRSTNSRNRVFEVSNDDIRTKTFEDALYTRTFEPGAPNFTPRISGLIDIESGLKLKLSILKSDEGDESQSLKFFYNYDNPKPGEGFLIHTYKENSDPLKSFEGEPIKVSLTGSIDEFCNSLWNSLNTDNKISLAVRYIDMATGKYEQIIKNKLEGM